MSRSTPAPAATAPDTVEVTEQEGQKLCLACGLCCRGALHPNADLDPEEVPAARAIGLPIVKIGQGKTAFQLPCPKHDGDRCTIYDQGGKPRVCGAYKCKLLERFLRGKIEIEESLAYVRQTQSLIADLRDAIGTPDDRVAIWRQLVDWSQTDRPKDAQTRLRIGVLWRLISNVFMPEEATADNWPDLGA